MAVVLPCLMIVGLSAQSSFAGATPPGSTTTMTTVAAAPVTAAPAPTPAASGSDFRCTPNGVEQGEVLGTGLPPNAEFTADVLIDSVVVATSAATESHADGTYDSAFLSFTPGTATSYTVQILRDSAVIAAANNAVNCGHALTFIPLDIGIALTCSAGLPGANATVTYQAIVADLGPHAIGITGQPSTTRFFATKLGTHTDKTTFTDIPVGTKSITFYPPAGDGEAASISLGGEKPGDPNPGIRACVTSPPSASAPGGTLAATGNNTAQLVLIGTALSATGALLTLGNRRRRQQPNDLPR